MNEKTLKIKEERRKTIERFSSRHLFSSYKLGNWLLIIITVMNILHKIFMNVFVVQECEVISLGKTYETLIAI